MKKSKKNLMKECPFAQKTCGSWCQLFNGKKCAFESIDSWLHAIAINTKDLKYKEN